MVRIDGDNYEELISKEAAYWGMDSEQAVQDGWYPGMMREPRRKVVKGIWDDRDLDAYIRGQYVSKILDFSSNKDKSACLELCCGIGWLAMEISRRGADVIGIDLSPKAIEIAKRYREKAGVVPGSAEFRVADLNRVVLPSSTYDLVYAWDGLHHVLEIERLVHEVWKALKPGGIIVIHDHAADSSAMRKILRRAVYFMLLQVIPTTRRHSDSVPKGCIRLMKSIPGRIRAGILALSHLKERGTNSIQGFPEAYSPFEDVSGENIIRCVVQNFELIELQRYLALPQDIYVNVDPLDSERFAVVQRLMRLDKLLSTLHLLRPEYFFLVAAKGTPEFRREERFLDSTFR